MKNLAKNPDSRAPPGGPLGVKKGALSTTCAPRPELFTPRSTQTSESKRLKNGIVVVFSVLRISVRNNRFLNKFLLRSVFLIILQSNSTLW